MKIKIYDVFIFPDHFSTFIYVLSSMGCITMSVIGNRRNKWITPRSIMWINIDLGNCWKPIKSKKKIHIRNLTKFLHQVLLRDDVTLDSQETKEIVNNYREKYGNRKNRL